MKLKIPFKKPQIPAKTPVKPPAEAPKLASAPTKGWAPRECTHCHHLYGNPCDGDQKCSNYAFYAKSNAKIAKTA